MVTPATGARVRLVSLGWTLVACGIAAGGLFERLRYEEYLLQNVDVLLETPEPYLGQVVGAERAERFMRRHVRAAGDPDGRPIFEVVR